MDPPPIRALLLTLPTSPALPHRTTWNPLTHDALPPLWALGYALLTSWNALIFSSCFLERHKSKKLSLTSLDRAICPPTSAPSHCSQTPGHLAMALSMSMSVPSPSLAASWVQFISTSPMPRPRGAPLSELGSPLCCLLRSILPGGGR